MSTHEVEPIGALDVIVEELVDLLQPLMLLGSADEVTRLVRSFGFDFPDTTPFPSDFGLVVQGLTDVEAAVVVLEAAHGDAVEDALLALLTAITEVVIGVVGLATTFEQDVAVLGDLLDNGFGEKLPRRLIDFIVVNHLAQRRHLILEVLLLLGLVEFEVLEESAALHQIDAIVATVHWERLPLLFSNPRKILDDVYGWSGTFDSEKLIARLTALAGVAGLPVGTYVQNADLADALQRPRDPRTETRAALLTSGRYFDGSYAELGLRMCSVPGLAGKRPGLAILPYVYGAQSFVGEPVTGWKVTFETALDLTIGVAFVLRPPAAPEIETGLLAAAVAPSARAKLGVKRAAPEGKEIVLVGQPSKTRVSLSAIGIALTATTGTPPELMISFDVTDLMVAVVPGDGDGFLQKVLPPKGIRAGGSLGIDASTKTGFRFRGGAGFEVEFPLALSLGGVIEIRNLWIRLSADAEALKLAVAATGVITIGPMTATIERIGLQGALKPSVDGAGESNYGVLQLEQSFRPPSGAGLAIKAGPVTGGGYIFFDPENEQYAGILQLSFKAIGITAICLLTTRLPDASGPPGATKKGFSLLIIIAIDLPPIQLGYGFTLNGVGGLMGIHRTMVVDALRNGVRDGSVNAILFPQDPVKRAAQIISQLRSIFPPAEGRFVFGPMVKIGWGPNAILELSAAVVLELMAPIRLVILGRIQAAIPDKKDTVLNIRLDIVGVLDFDRSEVSVDASLVDSRLTVFVLSGDMALRVGWGATKMFALAAGGFHPRFQPPAGFPALRRLGIALADSDNPRLRMETYFALTANTIQFGALLDAYVKVDTFAGTFSAAANFNFDALIQFSPFELMADLGASVDISRNGQPFLHAAIHAALTGPTPWHAIGYAEFDFLGKHRIDFEATVGTPATPPLPVVSPLEVLGKIVEAFSRQDAWVALPPAQADRIVTLADQDPGATVVVHPLGSLRVRQRVLPLGKSVNRFGAAVVEPTTFMLQGFQLGSGATKAPAEQLFDDFAPGQFTALTDDERLARPAFESMRSGGRMGVATVPLPSDASDGIPAAPDYEESIVDVEPQTQLRSAAPLGGTAASMPADALAALVHGGAAASAATRATGATEFRGPELGVVVRSEAYVVAGADTLTPVSGAPQESSAEAYDRLAKRSPAATPAQVVPAREAA